MYLRILELSQKIEKCGGISGVAQAFVDLRPMAFKADLYRACQLWDTGGLWLDDKVWLTKPFSSFVDVEKDLVVLPVDGPAYEGSLVRLENQNINRFNLTLIRS
jgi:hypothetical protein